MVNRMIHTTLLSHYIRLVRNVILVIVHDELLRLSFERLYQLFTEGITCG